jgi:ApbE superfamily uncharacterized protein (UPF0280 family)
MSRAPQVAYLADGRRLHLQDGPIDLVVQAYGANSEIAEAYRAAVQQFTGLLDTLCEELPELRRQAEALATPLRGRVARRMHAAVAPFAAEQFITPMAAVAGAVAQEILDAMTRAAVLDRAYVNNGGDIALHLAAGERFTVGLVDRPDLAGRGAVDLKGPSPIGTAVIEAAHRARGIATSGRHGRSFSLGIADAVTVLAATAAEADAAATVVANAVDLPGHPAITRIAACDLQPDSDLGERAVTRNVAALSLADIDAALDAGVETANHLMARGLIEAAALRLEGETRLVGIAAGLSLSFSVSHPRAKARTADTQQESLMNA